MSLCGSVVLAPSKESALVIVERVNLDGRGHVYVKYLRRFEPGTRYQAIAEHVQDLWRTDVMRGATLLMDVAPTGTAPLDLFRGARVWPKALWIAGGTQEGEDRVPWVELAGAVRALLDTGRFHIVEAVPDARALGRDLANVRSGTSREDTSASVVATALAVWWIEKRDQSFEGAMGWLRSVPVSTSAPAAVAAADTPCPECGALNCQTPWHRGGSKPDGRIDPEFREKFSTRPGVDHRGGHSFIGGWSRW